MPRAPTFAFGNESAFAKNSQAVVPTDPIDYARRRYLLHGTQLGACFSSAVPIDLPPTLIICLPPSALVLESDLPLQGQLSWSFPPRFSWSRQVQPPAVHQPARTKFRSWFGETPPAAVSEFQDRAVKAGSLASAEGVRRLTSNTFRSGK